MEAKIIARGSVWENFLRLRTLHQSQLAIHATYKNLVETLRGSENNNELRMAYDGWMDGIQSLWDSMLPTREERDTYTTIIRYCCVGCGFIPAKFLDNTGDGDLYEWLNCDKTEYSNNVEPNFDCRNWSTSFINKILLPNIVGSTLEQQAIWMNDVYERMADFLSKQH